MPLSGENELKYDTETGSEISLSESGLEEETDEYLNLLCERSGVCGEG